MKPKRISQAAVEGFETSKDSKSSRECAMLARGLRSARSDSRETVSGEAGVIQYLALVGGGGCGRMNGGWLLEGEELCGWKPIPKTMRMRNNFV